jgi:hypothetical protein
LSQHSLLKLKIGLNRPFQPRTRVLDAVLVGKRLDVREALCRTFLRDKLAGNIWPHAMLTQALIRFLLGW